METTLKDDGILARRGFQPENFECDYEIKWAITLHGD